MHARLDQNIALGGLALANTVEQLILDEHNLGALFDEDEKRHIILAGIATVGDLTAINEEGRNIWVQTNRLPTPCLEKITNGHEPPDGPLMLRSGQCYLLTHENCSPDLGQITEILGFTSTKRDEAYIRIWETKMNRPLAYRDTLTISPNTLSTGGGSNDTRKISDLFTTDSVHTATITGDIQGKGKNQPKLSRQYISAREHLTPTTRLPPTMDESIVTMIGDLVKDSGLNKVKIFTDGSYTQNNSQLQLADTGIT